ncbi:MAG: ABC transporter substrate-binding protein [Chloroflexota bacterium]|nr:ABC transporter substrate-binding protein [Chloroflexota bacterium]
MKFVFRVLAITSLLLSAFTVAAQDATSVTVAFAESQPTTLDPHAARTNDDFLVMRNVCEGLTNYDAVTLQPIPTLAESWSISDDGLVYTFTLRAGVTFTDGSTLDAADVKYSFDRLSDPNLGTSYTAGLVLRDVAGWAEARPPAPAAVGEGTPTPAPVVPAGAISGVEVIDAQTVQVTLTRPITSFLTRLTLPGGVIIAEGSAEGADFTTTGPVCTGPYSVTSWAQNDQVTLQANPTYWGGAPEVQTATIRVIPEASSQVIEFEAGSLDISVAPEADLPRIREDATLNAQLFSVPTLSNYNFRINLNDPKVGDVRVRRALALAIDRQLVIDTVLQGQGVPADGLFPPGLTTYDPDYAPFERDVEAARALLTEAGYPDGIEITIRTDQNETENRVLNAIAATVAEAGITLIVNSTEASVYTEDRTACTMEMGGIRWTMDYPDPENMVVLLLPNAATRVNCGYGTVDVAPQIQELYNQGITLPFGDERDQLFRQIEQIAMDNVLILPVYHGAAVRLISSRLGGTPIDNNGTIRFALMDVQ